MVLLMEPALPHSAIDDCGDTRAELPAALGEPFRANIVRARRAEIGGVIQQGVARGDLRPDVEDDIATELRVGPVYFRLMFGGQPSDAFAERMLDTVLRGYASLT
jgi:hypothetical protein